jgi:hypothetical protein
MKKLIFLFFILICFNFHSQNDTLRSNDPRYISNVIFGQLNQIKYQGKLLDRAMSDFQITNEQARGNYNQIHDVFSFLQMYSDVAYSYIDSTKLLNNQHLAETIINYFTTKELENDKLELPFCLLLHNLNILDSTIINANTFTLSNNQLISMINENTLYKNVLIKSSAILEFESDNGYNRGTIVYDERFISVSDDIDLQSIKINTGDGFKNFTKNHKFEFDRNEDSLIAYVALKYKLKNKVVKDTLRFYLTRDISINSSSTGQNKSTEDANEEDYWDNTFEWDGSQLNLLFRVSVKSGCGNTNGIRRPIIFAPPYRPTVQLVSMNTYYTQFGFKFLFEHLVSLGYDVIFIKEKPGNGSIEAAGIELAEFILYINNVKKINYPTEDWENVLVGYSAGGQHARFALMYLEKIHMDLGLPHHHTRLYIPFDAPHYGAHISMSVQSVYHDLRFFNPIAALTYFESLIDEGSKDMLMHHIAGSTISNSYPYKNIYPSQTFERTNLVNSFNNAFIHQYTHTNDLRKAFPSFTRNVAISTGNNDQNYDSQYGLSPGDLMFKQDVFLPKWYGFIIKQRDFYAGQFGSDKNAFSNYSYKSFLGIPFLDWSIYKTYNLPELDMAQGGYKDDFYNKVPTGATFILRSSTYYIGTQYYDKHLSFMPLVSALAINPNIWANNNLFYNLKDNGLMFQTSTDIPTNKSDIFGYPHLAHPTNHFNITPFEAVYADLYTYDHIKMKESCENDDLDETYLEDLRDFIVNEVEADVVCLQNKVIGENHNTSLADYKYKAWYKSENEIRIGASVTPKTDLGDYIIKQSGEITVYAAESVTISPGFHTQNGSFFHAFIDEDDCTKLNRMAQLNNNTDENNQNLENSELETTFKTNEVLNKKNREISIIPNPNNGTFKVLLSNKFQNASLTVVDIYGHNILTENQSVSSNEINFSLELKSGIYFLKIEENKIIETLKFIVQ